MFVRKLGLALALCGVTVAHAADEGGRAIVMQGNANGATACIACHGLDGAGNAAANFPRVGGMDAAYLRKQLLDNRNGTRHSPIMTPVAQALSDAELQAVTTYYSKQRPQVVPVSADAEMLAHGERIATRGIWAREIPACFSCHAPGGTGIGAFPAIAGQHAGYIAQQIEQWKNGGRSNDALGLMKAVSDRLTPDETAAVAAYLASLKP
jgi:cytochrome c553